MLAACEALSATQIINYFTPDLNLISLNFSRYSSASGVGIIPAAMAAIPDRSVPFSSVFLSFFRVHFLFFVSLLHSRSPRQ